MKKFLTATLLASGLVIAGCSSDSANYQTRLTAACQGYASILSSLALNKDRLTEEHIAVVNDTRSTVNPICTDIENVGDARTSLATVRSATRQLNEVQP